MGDAPLAFVETAGGVRVSEDDVVTIGKTDVSIESLKASFDDAKFLSDPLVQSRTSIEFDL